MTQFADNYARFRAPLLPFLLILEGVVVDDRAKEALSPFLLLISFSGFLTPPPSLLSASVVLRIVSRSPWFMIAVSFGASAKDDFDSYFSILFAGNLSKISTSQYSNI